MEVQISYNGMMVPVQIGELSAELLSVKMNVISTLNALDLLMSTQQEYVDIGREAH